MSKALYVGVLDQSKKIKKLYVGVNGVAKEVKSAYVGSDDLSKLVYQNELVPGFYDASGNLIVTWEDSGCVFSGSDPQKTRTTSLSYLTNVTYPTTRLVIVPEADSSGYIGQASHTTLKEIILKPGYSKINGGAFWDNPNLERINVLEKDYGAYFTNIYAAPFTFAENPKLKKIELGIGETFGSGTYRECGLTFYGDTSLEEIEFFSDPDNENKYGVYLQPWTFAGCKSLKKIVANKIAPLYPSSFPLMSNGLLNIYDKLGINWYAPRQDTPSANFLPLSGVTYHVRDSFESVSKDGIYDVKTVSTGIFRYGQGYGLCVLKDVDDPYLEKEPGFYDGDWQLLYRWEDLQPTLDPTEGGTIDPADNPNSLYTLLQTMYTEVKIAVVPSVDPEEDIAIGPECFYGCSNLTNIIIGSGYSKIDEQAFYGCSGATMILIDEGPTELCSSAFRDCTRLTWIALPASMGTFHASAFYGATALKKILVRAKNISVGNNAFGSLTALTDLYMPFAESFETSSLSVFAGTKAKFIWYCPPWIVPSAWAWKDNVQTEYWWESLLGGTNVQVNDMAIIKTIYDDDSNMWGYRDTSPRFAFSGGEKVFYVEGFYNENFINKHFLPDSSDFSYNPGSSFKTDTKSAYYIINNELSDQRITDIILDPYNNNMGSYMISECPDLRRVFIISNKISGSTHSIKNISDHAFYNNPNLEYIYMGLHNTGGSSFANCYEIGNYAFAENPKLKVFSIGPRTSSNYGMTIGANVFENDTSLQYVLIIVSVTKNISIGANAFKNCTSLKEIMIMSGYTGSASHEVISETAFTGCSNFIVHTRNYSAGTYPTWKGGTNVTIVNDKIG